uniref:Non-specific serine/threonine protein kinase n=1 Tax=Angiostrongylus cantonensis TaxID=6313 RepID=A0A0K0DF56_ANGCA
MWRELTHFCRRGEEPISRNKIGQLEFSHFVITSPHPMLAKGKSLFYNALLPRPGNSDYLVTLMIASYSQYAPLMRRSSSRLFMLPGFLELEDIDGSVKKFLHDTGTPNLDGRHTKVIAMPRLNLCSFHTLAAHHSNERINSTAHEQLVSFILLQLLTALRMLQSDGVELLSTNFKEFLLAYRFAPDSQQEMLEFPRLIFLPETFGAEIESGGDEMVGLCRYAMRALCTLLRHRMDGKPPPIQLRSGYSRALLACATLLQEDKSSSLTKAKNVLEIALWGGEPCHTDVRARIWLDMARAECVDMMLRQLVCEPGCRLGASEHYQVEFLLSATPRSIVESHRAILAANI